MDFIAIDVETANSDPASICQIGIANFKSGKLAGTWSRLIDPQTTFSARNTSIHGIRADMVSGQMRADQVLPAIANALRGRVVVAHSGFDQAALARAAERAALPWNDWRWLDSSRVARRVWPEVSRSGYGLRNLCRMIGHEFPHHHAEADAEACGRVLVRACEITGHTLDHWMTIADEPISLGGAIPRRKAGATNPGGHLVGLNVVFTGAFDYPRDEMVALALEAGCGVAVTPSRKITHVVIGGGFDELRPTEGFPISGKHKRAKELVAEGNPLTIIGEATFMALLRGKD